nr:MAG TPA: Ras-related protein Rab-11A, Rab11 family-interacting-ase, coiled-coil, PROTEIN TRANSPORT [Caudoviricetes sp.]
MDENRRLIEKIEKQAAKIDRLNAYIDGLQDALCRQPKIIINGGDASGLHERDL